MNRCSRVGCTLLLLVLSAASAAGARGAPSAPVKVAIPSAGLSSSPAPLVAFDFAPQGAGAHPAIVMMHGCGGAYARNGALGARHRMWGEYLASLGYEALMLDSFSSRGIKEICTTRYGERVLKESDRVADAYAALAWLRTQPGVDAVHIGLLGWSHGAGVTLDAIRHKPASTVAPNPQAREDARKRVATFFAEHLRQ
jgi:dienelactone hydrolase